MSGGILDVGQLDFEHGTPRNYDLFEEIDFFLKKPDKCLKEERKWKKEMDEEMHKSMEGR